MYAASPPLHAFTLSHVDTFTPFHFLATLLAGVLVLAGCGYYSFTGASIPSHLQTIAIPLAENTSASPVLGLDDRLTQLFQERFVGQTRLSLAQTEDGADAVLTARIDRYANQPTAVGGNEQAQQNRVSISVVVRYFDRVEEKEILSRTFTGSAEYDPVAEGLAGEERAALAALRAIAEDVFTSATSNW